MNMLEKTSRTFYIPISRLVPGLKEAVAAAYLGMRAIDEIEDHPELDDRAKIELLRRIGEALRSPDLSHNLQKLMTPYQATLPEVTMRLREWMTVCPASISRTVYRYIAKMSEQMADWVQSVWTIRTKEDLDRYTYSVAGMVGELLSELWLWHDGTKSDPIKAVGFGRGLQAVNILRNREEDLARGVDFFPNGWGKEDMIEYTSRNLQLADAYIAELKEGPALDFCRLPLMLAHATLQIIASGGTKLTRSDVLEIVGQSAT